MVHGKHLGTCILSTDSGNVLFLGYVVHHLKGNDTNNFLQRIHEILEKSSKNLFILESFTKGRKNSISRFSNKIHN